MTHAPLLHPVERMHMPRFLVSGKAELAADVAAAMHAEGAETVEVGDLAALTRVCAAAGQRAFDGYVQLPARFTVEGDSAVERVRHYISGGVLARFSAVAAVLPSLVPNARITFVTGALPPEVSTEDEATARGALVRVLGHAARADSPDGLQVDVLSPTSSPKEIALTALGRKPKWEALAAADPDESYTDWRVEVLGLISAEM
jgi:hypothetical protein